MGPAADTAGQALARSKGQRAFPDRQHRVARVAKAVLRAVTALDMPAAGDDATLHMPPPGRISTNPLVLAAASAILLNLAFSPFNQFCIAWFALAPWIAAVIRCRSALRAAAVGYVSGL